MTAQVSGKFTKQQDAVLIALTRDWWRTIEGISIDLGIPQASVRRTIGQLKRFGFGIRTEPLGHTGVKKFTLNPRVS